jgi:hypothetical protein
MKLRICRIKKALKKSTGVRLSCFSQIPIEVFQVSCKKPEKIRLDQYFAQTTSYLDTAAGTGKL